MKERFLTILLFLTALSGFSQKEFFRSQQVFTKDQLAGFYSSFTVKGDLVLFVANDYHLYAYNKTTGAEKWSASLKYKTNIAPVLIENRVYTGVYAAEKQSTAEFDAATGKLIRQLPVGPLATGPVLKDGVLFGTALYEGGCLFAYDTKQDSLLWWRFLAHGFSTQSYFFPNYIQANAEGNNWATIDYKGRLTDTACKEKADIFVSDIPCVRKFCALAHDGFELDVKFSVKNFGDELLAPENVLREGKNSFVLYNDKLAVIGNKGRIRKLIEPAQLLPDTVAGDPDGLNQLLAANEETISFIYYDNLLVYDYLRGKLIKLVELAAWQPHQAIINENKLWLISKKDGLLYGLDF